MLVIRLARQGRNKYPVYRIVAAESSRAVTGKFVAVLGHYNPHTKELVIKKEETVKYLGNGAQPSNSVVKLLQREKIELPQWVELKTKTRAPKKEPVVKEVSAAAEATVEASEAEAPAEAAEETPENEAPAEEVAVADAPADEAEKPVVAVAAEHAEATEAKVAEAAPEDTAAGEEAKAEALDVAEDGAAEAAAEAAE